MNFATGLGASTKLLRLCDLIISQGIINIINLSLSTGVFPNAWKKTRACAIPKTSSEKYVNNYRPISILSNLSEIIERHVDDSLFKYMSKHKLLSDSQFSFRKSLPAITV